MRRRIFPALFFVLLLASTSLSQQLATRLTNKDVIDMVGLGLSDDVVISKIRSGAAGGTLQFDTSVTGLKELKAAKVAGLEPHTVTTKPLVVPASDTIPAARPWHSVREIRYSRFGPGVSTSSTHAATNSG